MQTDASDRSKYRRIGGLKNRCLIERAMTLLRVRLRFCSRPLSRICEDGRPRRLSATLPYRQTVHPGSLAIQPATMPSITSYQAPRNRFRLSRSSKQSIPIRRLIPDRTTNCRKHCPMCTSRQASCLSNIAS